MLLKLESELHLEAEAAKLEPLFSGGEALAQFYGEKRSGRALACTSPTRATARGFWGFSKPAASLPANEQKRSSDELVRQFLLCGLTRG
jgi:hypothetical protein